MEVFRLGLFIYFMTVTALVGYYVLEGRPYIGLDFDQQSGIYIEVSP